jgi:4-phytase/acid phosphatase
LSIARVRPRVTWFAAGVAATAAWSVAAALASPIQAAPLTLKFVVILTRHGVRAPTWDAAQLKQYSTEPWPDWGAAPGELTSHGRELMTQMGSYYRDRLSSEGLLEPGNCASANRVYVWADTAQRTMETGRALADALMPRCGVAVHSLPDGDTDPLFDPIATGLATPDPDVAARAVRERLGPRPDQFLEPHRGEFELLQNILTDGASAPRTVFESLTVGVAGNGKTAELNGPLNTASTFTENLLLEYANGFEGRDFGWGRLTRENLDRVLTLHGLYADLMRRTPYLARARGSNLLAHPLHSLEQAASGRRDAAALGGEDDALLVVSGHDTNLSNLSGMLGLSWKLPSYQLDETPPGGALLFSLWRDGASHEDFVKTEFVAQTLEQMHRRTPLSLAVPPERTTVTIPGCNPADARGCPWPTVQRVLQQAIDPKFSAF